VEIDEIEGWLIISSEGASTSVRVPLDDRNDACRDHELLRVTVWNDPCDAYEVSAEASSWFDAFLKSQNARPDELIDSAPEGSFKLVRLCPSFTR